MKYIQELRESVCGFVREYPEKTGERNIWREPLLASASADDRFQRLREIAAPDHLMPRDLLPSAKSVLVFFIPFSKELALENRRGDIPCRNWGLAYESTNRLIGKLCEHIRDELEKRGFQAELTPATHNFDPIRLMSRWSHKHLGYLCGLGRFGVNAQFITPSGCAGRLGSLVTDADTGDHPLVEEAELCLHKRGHKCLICVKRCPVGAVSEAGIDRQKCWERLQFNLTQTEQMAGLENTTHVCGKCQVLLPCSLKIPSTLPVRETV
ncbi:MAG: hypothetical protein AB7S75_20040 [Desulfococcaceae bacterium]